jgi:hypothetical protein
MSEIETETPECRFPDIVVPLKKADGCGTFYARGFYAVRECPSLSYKEVNEFMMACCTDLGLNHTPLVKIPFERVIAFFKEWVEVKDER